MLGFSSAWASAGCTSGVHQHIVELVVRTDVVAVSVWRPL